MLVINHQILDLENIVYTTMPLTLLRKDAITEVVLTLDSRAVRKHSLEPVRYLIVFPFAKDHVFVGLSNSQIMSSIAYEHIQFQTLIHLESAVRTRYEGPFEQIPHGLYNLYGYLEAKSLHAITSVYGIIISGIKDQEDNECIILDMYAGINRNIVLPQV